MIGSLYSAISGLDASTEAMSVIGDNIANVSTTGFKSSTTLFANLLNQSMDSGSSQPGSGVKVDGLSEQWAQGTLAPTGNATNLAINGSGLFCLEDPSSGQAYYSRAGDFGFDANGYLTNPDGLQVLGYSTASGYTVNTLPTAAPAVIQVDETATSNYEDYQMANDGIISGLNKTTGARDNLWQVSLNDFPNLQGLTKLGNNVYTESSASGAPILTDGSVSGIGGMGTIGSGNLEDSNVDLATEFTNMIVTEKAFDANAKVITTSNNILTALIQTIQG